MKKQILLATVLFLLSLSLSFSQSVGINPDGSAPDGSAMLDVKATDKGILIPRIDFDNKPASPSQGLLIYVTAHGPQGNDLFYYYDGSAWQALIGSNLALLNGDNVFIGFLSGKNTTSGSANSALGYQSLYSNTTGYSNVASGVSALHSNTIGNFNIAIGASALYSNTIGDYNMAIGASALYSNTTGNHNMASGVNALYSNTTGNYNIANGNFALSSNISGLANITNGDEALFSNVNGSYNLALGFQAGRSCLGSRNVFIGNNAGYNEIGSDRLYIDNSNTNAPLICGDFLNDKIVINGNSSNNINNRTFFVNGSAGGTGAWWNDSDKRLKKNITTISNPLEKVMKLRGVNYEWIDQIKHEKGLQIGFIAQETEKVLPEVVGKPADEKGFYSMQYAPITALLVEAVKEQQLTIEKQQAQIDELKKMVEKLLNK